MMMPTEFADTRDLLKKIRAALGDQGLVSLAWDGNHLRVGHARPDTGKPMMIMTFDALLALLATTSAEHFK